MQYSYWCNANEMDFDFHIEQVLEGDSYYVQLATKKMKEFGA